MTTSLYTVDEVAQTLRLAPRSVYERISSGELAAIRLGFRPEGSDPRQRGGTRPLRDASSMSTPDDRRQRREEAHARAYAAFEAMLPRAAEVLTEAAEKGDRRALTLLERIKRERPDLLPSEPTTTHHDPAPTALSSRAQRARDRAFQRSLHRRP